MQMSLLGEDLSSGVRASARSVAAAEAGLKTGAALVSAGVANFVVPAVKARAPAALGSPPSFPHRGQRP